MSSTRGHAPLSGPSLMQPALTLLLRAVVGVALLIGLTLLALVFVAALVLRAVFGGRRAKPVGANPSAFVWRGAHSASPPSRARGSFTDVVDVEARDVTPPEAPGR